ncbi:MAG: S49 family peptidase [Pseudomonadales bacterium]|nr:S49 family peptidase [Pseudomonadales bacterium]
MTENSNRENDQWKESPVGQGEHESAGLAAGNEAGDVGKRNGYQVERPGSAGVGQSGDKSKEWKLIEKLVSSVTQEQRRSRRWGIFFKSLTFIYLFLILGVYFGNLQDAASTNSGLHTALVDVHGVIAEGEGASADTLVTGLRRAFDSKGTRGVVLRINSPGGSPVQAGYVYDEIKRLKSLHPDVPVYAVISDLGASGAYYIAAAADYIYADKASLVGSVGVTASGFGFVEVMEKLGVERRLYTAGEHKAFLDPFSPQKQDEVQFWESVLKTTHNQFIEQVKKGRGDKLADDPKLFTGLVWSGEQALELGLVDGLGSPGYVARELIGYEDVVDFTPKPDPFERFTKTLGASISGTAVQLLFQGQFGLR